MGTLGLEDWIVALTGAFALHAIPALGPTFITLLVEQAPLSVLVSLGVRVSVMCNGQEDENGQGRAPLEGEQVEAAAESVVGEGSESNLETRNGRRLRLAADWERASERACGCAEDDQRAG